MTEECLAELAELAAEIPPHLRRIDALAKKLQSPAKEALEAYSDAGLDAIYQLQRLRVGQPR